MSDHFDQLISSDITRAVVSLTGLVTSEEMSRDQFIEPEPIEMVCKAFVVSRSSYYDYRHRRSVVGAERVVLRADVNRIFRKSQRPARSRMITTMFKEEGIVI
jgi:putative transposase